MLKMQKSLSVKCKTPEVSDSFDFVTYTSVERVSDGVRQDF